MIEVKVKDGSDDAFKNALKIFKKVCTKEGILREAKERRYYKKPSEKKREYRNSLKRKHEQE